MLYVYPVAFFLNSKQCEREKKKDLACGCMIMKNVEARRRVLECYGPPVMLCNCRVKRSG